jgi:hypothetical protein
LGVGGPDVLEGEEDLAFEGAPAVEGIEGVVAAAAAASLDTMRSTRTP